MHLSMRKIIQLFINFLGWVQGQTLFDLSSFYVLLDIVIIGKVFYSKYICLITLRWTDTIEK